MMDLVFTNREGLVKNVELKGSLGCSDYEMVEFEILKAVRRASGRLTSLDFVRAGFDLFKDLLGRVLWDKSVEGRHTQSRWLIFKDPSKEGKKSGKYIKRHE